MEVPMETEANSTTSSASGEPPESMESQIIESDPGTGVDKREQKDRENGPSVNLAKSAEMKEDAESTPSLNFDVDKSPSRDTTEVTVEDQVDAPADVSYTGKSQAENEGSIAEALIKEEDAGVSNRIVHYVNLDAKITPSPIIQYTLDNDLPWDTVIGCADGKLGAHRLILASASPFIGDLFISRDHRLGEVATLILPDVTVAVMKVILNFCYTGQMYFPVENEEEILNTLKLLLIGEYGKMSINKVTVRVPPPPPPPVPGPSTGVTPQEVPNYIPDERPGTSSSMSIPIDDDAATSSSEEEEDSDSNSEADDETERNRHFDPSKDEEMARIKMANNLMRRKNRNEEDASINYLIPPKPVGSSSKSRTIMCNHCPAAFKSMQNLETHLDKNHGLFSHSCDLTNIEFEELTECTYCSQSHTEIASANNCIGRRSRTRCFICFEIVAIKKFEAHIKNLHTIDKRDGMHIVKCRWCDAGILLRDPIDNKAMAAHCFAQHFRGAKKGVTIEMDKDDRKKKEIEALPNIQSIKEEKLDDVAMEVEAQTDVTLAENKKTKQQSIDRFFSPASSTSKSSSVTLASKPVPPVLATPQNASHKKKRKLKQETDAESNLQNMTPSPCENPKKRARLDSNGKRLQVAKRTGVPVGRLVDLNSLKKDVPTLKSTPSNKGKSKTVLMDLANVPQIYVKFNYEKAFVLEYLAGKTETETHERNTAPEEDSRMLALPETPFEAEHATINLLPDSATSDLQVPGKRLSDSRCSLPIP